MPRRSSRGRSPARSTAGVACGALSSRAEKPTLWRWSRGDAAPTKLGEFEGLHDAAWVPDGVPMAPVTPVPDVAPLAADEIVVLRGDNSLVVLDVRTGGVVHDLGSVGLGGEGLSGPLDLSSDRVALSLASGRRMVFHDGERVECDPDARLVFGRESDGMGGDIVGRGNAPSASPDGRRLADLGGPSDSECEVRNTELVVRDLDTGVERRWSVDRGRDGWVGHVDVDGHRTEEIGCPESVKGCRVHDVLVSPEGDRTLLLVEGEGVRALLDAETGEVIADEVVAVDW